MTKSDTAQAKTRISIQSLLILVGFAVLAIVAVAQHRQGQQLQHQLEMLSSRIEHLNASDDLTAAKLDTLRRAVSDEPILSVDDLLAGKHAVQTGG